MISGLLDLDATTVLSHAQTVTREQRERDVDVLRLALRWADLHSDEPGAPGEPRTPGSDRLVALGGEGTPLVQELCWAELAIARHSGVIAMQRLAADALDLRHRLPQVWAAVEALRLPVWVARRVASMSRALSNDRVGIVDRAVAASVAQAPARIISIAEAKVIEADVEAHRARLAEDAARCGVRLSRARPGDATDPIDGEPATRRVTLKLPVGAAIDFDAAVGEVADALHAQLSAEEQLTITRGELETKAVELLTNPHAAAAFLDAVHGADDQDEPVTPPKPTQRPATLYVHVSDLVLGGLADGVARAEGLGPMLLEQVTELLQHRNVALQPVIDLREIEAVNGYEHPSRIKHRTLLRMLGDAFPHSTNLGYRRLDHDHATPYRSGGDGPPGQTGDLNDCPLTRAHHRVKTHQRYQVRQLGLGGYRWITPHGLARVVTPSGTREVELLRDASGNVIGETYDGPPVRFHPRT
ncbi:hypothetical protein [Nocardioides stalactiti]|uniref:hypothetical protein n=1 Tax=Nocardioides stalactiti TaxID=2755356 RepID=UPI0015FEFFB5|nr:hypothetical protein [Nocardioides stalactiti]